MTKDWVEVLADQCAQTSQSAVARELAVSPALINQVLKGAYRGNVERVRDLVEGYYCGASVPCPVLGDVTRDVCRHHQERPFAATNPQRVRLYRACRGCEYSDQQQTRRVKR